MGQVGRALREMSASIESGIDRARYGIKRRMGRRPPFAIAAYPGFGNARRLVFIGRALEDRGVRPARDGDSRFRNLVNIYRRMHAGDLPRARVQVEFEGDRQEVVADTTGFFEVWLTPTSPLPRDQDWQTATVTLLQPVSRRQGQVMTTVGLLVPSASASFGVISDLDDTVIRTDATSLLRMARNVLFANARTRLPFPGVAAFYQALELGSSDVRNPIYYVSSGPWNLFDLIHEFLEVQAIPHGPIMLRRWGLGRGSSLPTRHAAFKLGVIRQILDLTPSLQFILIGDSGQEDPEVYREIVHEYPGRILAVYIRNVSRQPERSERIRALAAEVVERGVPLVLADDTFELAEHAAAHGWISNESLGTVRSEAAADESAAGEPPAPTVIVEEGLAMPTWLCDDGRGA